MSYNIREKYCPYCGRTHFMGFTKVGSKRRFVCYVYKVIFEEQAL